MGRRASGVLTLVRPDAESGSITGKLSQCGRVRPVNFAWDRNGAYWDDKPIETVIAKPRKPTQVCLASIGRALADQLIELAGGEAPYTARFNQISGYWDDWALAAVSK